MRIFHILFLGLSIIGFAAKVCAQTIDGPVGVAVNIKGLDLSWDYQSYDSLDISIDGLNGYQTVSANSSNSETDQLTARLEPGKTYFIDVASSDLNNLTIQAVPPPGYVVELENVARERLNLGYAGYTSVRLRVLSPFQQFEGRGGTATALTSGRVLWQVAMGYLSNGSSAGALAIIDTGTTANWTNLFSPAGFFYERTSTEVDVVYNAWNAASPYIPGTIRQIIAPQVCADIVMTGPYQAEIKFYHRSQLNAGTGIRTFTGWPFAWYQINQSGVVPNEVKISCDIRDASKLLTTGDLLSVKHTELARSGSAPNFTWRAEAWYYDGSPSLSRDYRVRSSGVESVTLSEPNVAITQEASRTYTGVPWGEEITAETLGTANSITTGYNFYTSSSQAGNYARLASKITTGGSWEAYEYYDYAGGSAEQAGALHRRHRPFKNSSETVPGNLGAHTGEITTFAYEADAFDRKTRPTLVETSVNGTVTARSATSYSSASSGFSGHSALAIITATRSDSVSSSSALTSITKYFREDAGLAAPYTDDFFRMQIHSVQQPTGAKQSFAYQRGTWGGGSSFTPSTNGGTDFGTATRISVITGSASSGASYTTHQGYNIDDLYLIEDKSTLEVTIRDEYARIRRTETHVWHSGAWNPVSHMEYDYNLANQLTERRSSNGGVYSATWSGELLQDETDETGIKVTYEQYDAAGRVKVARREAGGPIGELKTHYSYDAASRVTQSIVGWGQAETLVTSRSFDDAGRLTSETPPGLGATSISYSPSTRSRTINLPEGGSRTETSFPDGQLATVTGSATVEEHYDYSIISGGNRYAKVSVGGASSTRSRERWTDWLGRTTKTSRPGFSPTSQPAFEEESEYDSTTGQLIRSKPTGLAPNRYQYDVFGSVERVGLDIGDNGLVENSADRISDSSKVFELYEGAWWIKEETKTYPYDNGNSVILSVARKRLSGHATGVLDETRTWDAELNTAVRTVSVDRANKTTTVTTSRSGYSTNQVETVINGLLVSTVTHDDLGFSTSYDGLLRAHINYDSRAKPTTLTYKYGSTLIQIVKDAANHETTTYYDDRGRRRRVIDANGKSARVSYNLRGQLEYQWGDGAYPVSYGYDPTYGDRTTLNTYRGAPATDSLTWPAVGLADTTTFVFDVPSGLLHKKIDAAGRDVEYNYNWRGQTNQRFWSRIFNGSRVTTTYSYDENTGEPIDVSYTDGTPGVSYGYTRLGQLNRASDGVTGDRYFNYDTANARPWRLDHVQLGGFYGGRYFTALYETSGVVGRSKGFKLGAAAGSSSDLEQSYGFDAYGRFETLSSTNSAGSRTFRYTYKVNTGLVETLLIDGGHAFMVTRGYHDDLNLLTSIDSKWNGTSRTRFDYTYTNLNQRETAKQSGNAFADYGDSTYRRYGYNSRGELNAAPAYLGSNVASTAQPLPGRQNGYDYDSIGNRRWTNRTGNASLKESYFKDTEGAQEGANELNQYRSRENDTISVQGTVDSAATKVAVAGASVAADRQGRYWSYDFAVGNGAQPWQGTINVFAAKPGAGSGGGDLVRTEARQAQIAKALQRLDYDLDGNLSSDGVWDYQWDAENRLVRQTTTAIANTAGLPNRIITYSYDYMGRRVQKHAYNSATSTTISNNRYLYQGWNLVAEFVVSGTTLGSLTRSFTWGLDIVGSLTASGGVGALLQIHDYAAGKSLLPTYDGNGNVVSLLNANVSGALEAAYEYDPFGNLLRCEGAYAKDNPFRFSTKFQDNETGLIYYGHRYYDPSSGRFINRDPIEERGGFNLYGFCGNDGINFTDYLGYSWFSKYILRPIRKLLGWIDKLIAKNNVNVGGGDYVTYSVPLGSANPGGQIARTGPNPFPAGGAGAGSSGGSSGSRGVSSSGTDVGSSSFSLGYTYRNESIVNQYSRDPWIEAWAKLAMWSRSALHSEMFIANLFSFGVAGMVEDARSVYNNTGSYSAAIGTLNPGYQILHGASTLFSGVNYGNGEAAMNVDGWGRFAGGVRMAGGVAGSAGLGSLVARPIGSLLAAENGLSRSAVVSVERAEQLLIKYGRTAEEAKDYVASFNGPITARIVSPGESFLRYTDVATSKGSFLTKSVFGSPAEAVEGLYLKPYGNTASLLQDVTASGRSIILEGGVANGSAQQSLIVNRNAFQFGTGTGF